MQDIINFLTLNGFTHILDNKYNFTNNKCHIQITSTYNDDGSTYECYYVQTKEGEVYSNNLEIYWLIGYLTYYGCMDKNYKQLN